MNYDAKKLIEIALAEIGYREKKSPEQLDEPQGNVGAGNCTKYARDLYRAGYYNGNKQGVPWCSVFVDWCHYMAAGKDREKAREVSCQSGPLGAGCGYSLGYYRSEGRFTTQDPQPGDQIYFGSGNSVTHTGLVVKTDEKYVYTVEGNTASVSGVVSDGGSVAQKQYSRSFQGILGYGRPKFTKEKGVFTMEMKVLKQGAAGNQVRALQILLAGNGYSCGLWGADGKFGAATKDALMRYQKKNGLQTDGMAGPETWGSLLGAQ